MTTEPILASAAAIGRSYVNSKGVKVTITGPNPAGDKVIVQTEAGRTVDLDLTYPLYAIEEEAPAGAVTVASLVGRPRDAITPHLPALSDAELEQLGNLDTRMWLGHAIMEEIDRRGKIEAVAAPISAPAEVEPPPAPMNPALVGLPDPIARGLAASPSTVYAGDLVIDDPIENPPAAHAAVHPDDLPTRDRRAEVLAADGSTAARPFMEIKAGDVYRLAESDGAPVDGGAFMVAKRDAYEADGRGVIDSVPWPGPAAPAVEKVKRPRKPKPVAEPVAEPVDAVEEARLREVFLTGVRMSGGAAFRAGAAMPDDLTPVMKGAWREGFEAARIEHDATRDAVVASASDDDVFGWLDEALGHVTAGTGSGDRVQELIDDALEARETLREHLRPVLDALEAPLSTRNEALWNDVEAGLRAALRQLTDAADEEAPAPAPAADPSPTIADFPEARLAGIEAAKADAPCTPPAYDSPVAQKAWREGWMAWRPMAAEVEPAACPACERGASAYSAGIAHTCERFAHLGTPPAAPVFLTTVDEFAARYLREHGAPELADDAETLDTIRGLTANVREQMSALAGCYNGTVIAAALAWERANENRESLVRKLEERAGRIADGSARPRKVAPTPAPVVEVPTTEEAAPAVTPRTFFLNERQELPRLPAPVEPPAIDQVPAPAPVSHGPTLSAEGRKRAAAIRSRLEALREAVPAIIAAEEALAALRELGVSVDLGVHLTGPTPTPVR